jgi:hypothetical protein
MAYFGCRRLRFGLSRESKRGPRVEGGPDGELRPRGVGRCGRGGVQSVAGPGRGGAGLSSAGAGERRERGGGPIRGKMTGGLARGNKKKEKKKMGLAQGNSATF